MVVFPGAILVTTPVVAPTVATAGLLLVHEPTLLPFEVKLSVDPTHTDDPPLIVPAFRTGFTVMDADAVAVPQGVVTVYVMVALPAATPVTTPETALTVAVTVLLLLQVPPMLPLLINVVDKPAHTDEAPLTVPALASAFTVTSRVAVEVPQVFDTV